MSDSDLKSRLIEAIFNGDLELIRHAIGLGESPDVANGRGLYQLCCNGNIQVVRLLLELGANPNIADGRAVDGAFKYGRFEIVKALADHGADLCNISLDSILSIAEIRLGKGEMLEYLLARRSDLDVDRMLNQAIFYNSLENASVLLRHNAKPDMTTSMSDAMRDLITAHQKKGALKNKLPAARCSLNAELGL